MALRIKENFINADGQLAGVHEVSSLKLIAQDLKRLEDAYEAVKADSDPGATGTFHMRLASAVRRLQVAYHPHRYSLLENAAKAAQVKVIMRKILDSKVRFPKVVPDEGFFSKDLSALNTLGPATFSNYKRFDERNEIKNESCLLWCVSKTDLMRISRPYTGYWDGEQWMIEYRRIDPEHGETLEVHPLGELQLQAWVALKQPLANYPSTKQTPKEPFDADDQDEEENRGESRAQIEEQTS